MITLTDFVNLYRFKADRVLYTLSEMVRELNAAGGGGLTELLDELHRATDVAKAVRDLEIRWKGSRNGLVHGGEAKRVAIDMDRALGALDGFLGNTLQAWGAQSPQGEAAARLREGLFPHGVAYLIRLPYMRKKVQVAELLERVDGDPEVSATLRELKGEDFVERVREVHVRFDEVLRSDRAPTFAEIEEARRACHARFCAIVCLVAGRWGTSDPESAEGLALARALEEVSRQNRVIRLWYRRRRQAPEVDLETGEELVADESPLELEVEAAEGVHAPPVADPPALPDFDAKSEGAA